MDCERVRELCLKGDEGPLAAHADECPECAAWLEREQCLMNALSDLRSEAQAAVGDLPVRSVTRRRWITHAILAAAAVLILAFALSVVVPSEDSPKITVTRVVLIEGKVRDDTAPPAYIEVEGRKFDVQRVSQDEGIWRAELEVPAAKKVFLLSAMDANGNERRMELRLIE